jgi:hypothetical protein
MHICMLMIPVVLYQAFTVLFSTCMTSYPTSYARMCIPVKPADPQNSETLKFHLSYQLGLRAVHILVPMENSAFL